MRDHVPYFILDTAASADLHTRNHLRASAYMQPFKLRKEYDDGWLDQIAAGNTYVTPTYEHDDYGYFLTAHVPIHDSQGRYSGFVGVDFDMQYYLGEEARFRVIEAGSLAVAVIVALLIGFLVALYYTDLQQRMRELYHRATRDDLTGLLNRRGAKAAVDEALANARRLLRDAAGRYRSSENDHWDAWSQRGRCGHCAHRRRCTTEHRRKPGLCASGRGRVHGLLPRV